MSVLILTSDDELLSGPCNFACQNIRDLLIHYFAYLRILTAILVTQQVSGLFIQLVLAEMLLLFWLVCQSGEFGWRLWLIEDVVC